MREQLKNCNRIVVKIGTSSLTYPNGKINLRIIDKLARILCDLKNSGKEICLVTSGAIGVGVDRLKLSEKPKTVSGRQAAACVGQSALMEIYNKSFADYGYVCGQLLLTKDVLDTQKLKTNALNTFNQMFEYNVIPVVNENDSISVDEIKFGDNDNLSSLVSQLIGAELLIILTDIDGLFDADPRTNPQAKLISTVTCLDETVEVGLSNEGGKLGTGGIVTKVRACRLAAENGIHSVIVNALRPEVIYDVTEGIQVGTYFVPKESK